MNSFISSTGSIPIDLLHILVIILANEATFIKSHFQIIFDSIIGFFLNLTSLEPAAIVSEIYRYFQFDELFFSDWLVVLLLLHTYKSILLDLNSDQSNIIYQNTLEHNPNPYFIFLIILI